MSDEGKRPLWSRMGLGPFVNRSDTTKANEAALAEDTMLDKLVTILGPAARFTEVERAIIRVFAIELAEQRKHINRVETSVPLDEGGR